MTVFSESDFISRDDLCHELRYVDIDIDVIEFEDGWSLRTAGSRELAYLRKSDGWTRHQLTCVTLLLQAVEDLFRQRWEQTIDDLEGTPADFLAAAGNVPIN
jgi:hypothetical protein